MFSILMTSLTDTAMRIRSLVGLKGVKCVAMVVAHFIVTMMPFQRLLCSFSRELEVHQDYKAHPVPLDLR